MHKPNPCLDLLGLKSLPGATRASWPIRSGTTKEHGIWPKNHRSEAWAPIYGTIFTVHLVLKVVQPGLQESREHAEQMTMSSNPGLGTIVVYAHQY